MGPPSPYRYVSLGFSSWNSPHIQGGLGHEERCGGHRSILGSQPINDQLGPALVSAEEDLQAPKVNSRTGGFPGWEEPQGCAQGKEAAAQRFSQPWLCFRCPLCSPGTAVSHVQSGSDAQSRAALSQTLQGYLVQEAMLWFGEVLLSPAPAHRVPPPVAVLVLAADAQPAPAHVHQEDKAPVGDKESHGGAPLACHVEEQPTGGVQLHLQGEMGPAGTESDGSTRLSHNCKEHVLAGHDPRARFAWGGHGARLTSTQRRLGSHQTPSGCSGPPRSGRCPWLRGAGGAAGTARPGRGGGPSAQACPAPTQCAPGNGVRGASLHAPAEQSSGI